MSRVLITGGAGFIGYVLAKALVERGDQVDLIDNFARGVRDPGLEKLLAHDNVELFDIDLTKPHSLGELSNNYDLIFHLAAIIGVKNVMERPDAVVTGNVKMLAAMLDFAKKQSELKRFVFTSTSEVYAGSLLHLDMPIPTPEDTPLALTALDSPRTTYMLSKIYGEVMCRHSGVPFTIVRPHNFYGPRMGLAHVVPELLKRAHESKEGDALTVYSVDHQRTFCFIDDAVEMVLAVTDSKAGLNQVFNVGRQSPETSIGEVAKTVIDVVGKELRIEPGPVTAGSPTRRCPDMTRMKETVRLEATTSLHDGVSQCWEWYRPFIFEGDVPSAR